MTKSEERYKRLVRSLRSYIQAEEAMREEIIRLRQRVAELETVNTNLRVELQCYKDAMTAKLIERGERMKWLRAELKKYCKIEPNFRWFDPETGEPL